MAPTRASRSRRIAGAPTPIISRNSRDAGEEKDTRASTNDSFVLAHARAKSLRSSGHPDVCRFRWCVRRMRADADGVHDHHRRRPAVAEPQRRAVDARSGGCGWSRGSARVQVAQHGRRESGAVPRLERIVRPRHAPPRSSERDGVRPEHPRRALQGHGHRRRHAVDGFVVHAATLREHNGKKYIRLGDYKQAWLACE
jgi:hypothetical protein